MYFVTCFTHVDYDQKEHETLPMSRCWGYFSNIENAKDALLSSFGETLHEYRYSYAIIEEIEEGIHSFTKSELWYKWDGRRWVDIKKPIETEAVINFSIG